MDTNFNMYYIIKKDSRKRTLQICTFKQIDEKLIVNQSMSAICFTISSRTLSILKPRLGAILRGFIVFFTGNTSLVIFIEDGGALWSNSHCFSPIDATWAIGVMSNFGRIKSMLIPCGWWSDMFIIDIIVGGGSSEACERLALWARSGVTGWMVARQTLILRCRGWGR